MSEIKLTSVIDGDDLIVNDVDSDEEDYDDYGEVPCFPIIDVL